MTKKKDENKLTTKLVNANIMDNKETQGYRKAMAAYLPAWQAAKAQRAYLNFRREQFQKKAGPVRHPVLVRDILK